MSEQTGREGGSRAAARAISKPAPLKPAYLILGDDSPKVELALKRLKTRVAGESGSDINIDEFNAASDGAVEVVNAANTLAFLSGTRLVLVRGVQSWLKADKEAVAAYLNEPAPDTCLALVATALPPKDILRAATEKHGDILEYQAPKEGQLPSWLVKEAARMQLRLGLAEARLLVQRCGDNQNILLRELEKLRAYVGSRQVETEDIRLLTIATVEANIFDLLDSLALGRGRQEARGSLLPDSAELPESPARCRVARGRAEQRGHSSRTQNEAVSGEEADGAGEPLGR